MKNFYIATKPAPRADIERQENVGDCFKSIRVGGDHYYLVRENDVLHVTEGCINTLYDNSITEGRHNRDEKYKPIKRKEFNEVLNQQIFDMNIFAKEFKDV